MILGEFDESKKAVINPSNFIKPVKKMPKVAVGCFARGTFARMLDGLGGGELLSESRAANMVIPVYRVVWKDIETAVFLCDVGAPACVALLEDIWAMGVQTVILFGTCGVLDASIRDCSVIIPDSAVRDEGTSYHYMPASDEISVNPKYRELFTGILERLGCGYTVGKAWTTDAVYRETKEKAARRKAQGCICVDMECSAAAAAAQFRGRELFHFFYAADNLDAENWESRSLSDAANQLEKDRVALLAMELAAEITKFSDGSSKGREETQQPAETKTKEERDALEQLCRSLGLGGLTQEPRALTGGYLHKMFEINTEAGRFAIKALNPEITARDGALNHFSASEEVANRLNRVISSGCARSFHEKYVQELGGKYYLIYDFLPGKTLSLEDIAPEHAAAVGGVLAEIHNADLTAAILPAERSGGETADEAMAEPEGESDSDETQESGEGPLAADWLGYASLAAERGTHWSARLKEMLPLLSDLTEKSIKAKSAAEGGEVVCHCDMDSKNVLWHDGKPTVIDWEAAGLLSPCRDFLDTVLYWSMKQDGKLDKSCFRAFSRAYCEKRGRAGELFSGIDWENILYEGCEGRLGWLEYSLKRALGLCTEDPAEQELGASQIVPVLDDIAAYRKLFPEIMELIRETGLKNG